MPNYDNVAWFYDGLSRMVYGRAQVNAQVYLLHAIPPGARVLIAGGGTGWILEEIAQLHPSGLTITYVDASARMITQAQKRNAGENKVTFINAYIEDAAIGGLYDVVLTPFLFDNLTEAVTEKVFNYVDRLLDAQGKWLYCDFRNTGIWWHRLLLWTMYTFFRALSAIEADHLPDIEARFTKHGYIAAGEKTFFRNFVVSIVYKKNQPR